MFHVGVAYAITAWVLTQVLDIFLPTFGAPDWVMKVMLPILIAGLPIAHVTLQTRGPAPLLHSTDFCVPTFQCEGMNYS